MNVSDFLYFDIETVGKYKDAADLKLIDPKLYSLFLNKLTNKGTVEVANYDNINEQYKRMSPITPEYGKIVCASFGYIDSNENWKTHSFIGEEEEIVIKSKNIFEKAMEKQIIPCGYNIIPFDLPWFNKKMIKYGVRVPYSILSYNKKPWEIKVLDLCEVWKGTGRAWSSLDEVTHELGVPSPKGKLSGDMVHDAYWIDNAIDKIATYCEGDVKALKDVVEKLIISYE